MVMEKKTTDPIHFVHTSDWHLGFFQHNKPERNADYYDAARKTVREIRRINPQFVIHTGDLFHHARPSPGAIRQAVGLFSSLTNANIPIYIIRGNHDGRSGAGLDRGGGVIELLDDLELVHFIDDKRVQLENYGVEILGIGYYPGRGVVKHLDEILAQEQDFLDTSMYKIVALHAFVEGQLEDITHLPLSKLSSLGVDYIGVGHYHIPWNREKTNIYVPGSSEATSSSDWNRPDKKDGITVYSSFYEIKVRENESVVTTHQIPVRPKIKIIAEIKNKDPSELIDELSNLVDKKREKIVDIEPRVANIQPMIDIELHSDLKFDQIAQVSALLEEKYTDTLHFNLNAETEFASHDSFSTADFANDVEEILLQESNLTQESGSEFLNLATKLIDELGKIPAGRNLADDTFSSLFKIFSSDEMKAVSAKLLGREEVNE